MLGHRLRDLERISDYILVHIDWNLGWVLRLVTPDYTWVPLFSDLLQSLWRFCQTLCIQLAKVFLPTSNIKHGEGNKKAKQVHAAYRDSSMTLCEPTYPSRHRLRLFPNQYRLGLWALSRDTAWRTVLAPVRSYPVDPAITFIEAMFLRIWVGGLLYCILCVIEG
jgi:hypothetical protein